MKLSELRRTQNTTKKKVVLKASKPLKDIEAQFKKFIRKMLRDIEREFKEDVIDDIPTAMLDHYPNQFTDANFVTIIKKLSNTVKRKINEKYNDWTISRFVRRIYSRTGARNEAKFNSSVKRELGVDLEAILATDGQREFTEEKISEAVEYITNLRDEAIMTYKMKTIEGVNKGKTGGLSKTATLAEVFSFVKKATGMKLKSGDLLARQNLKNFNFELSNKRMEDLGVELVRWKSVDDGRVRCTHRALNGFVYRRAKGITMKDLQKAEDFGKGIKNKSLANSQTCSVNVKVTTSRGVATEHTKPKTETFQKEMDGQGGAIRAGQGWGCRCYEEAIVEF